MASPAYPEALEELMELLRGLPGVGRRSAERMALQFYSWDETRLKILSRLERITVNSPAVRHLLGKVEERDGVLCGISGLELEHDARLRGEPGRFEVLLDRYRHWMERSWKLLAEPLPGEDVQLNESVTELEARGMNQ